MVSARIGTAPAAASLPPWQRPWFARLVLALAAALAYAGSFGGAFVFDDDLSIPGNPTLASLWRAWWPPTEAGITVSGRPVLNFSFALNRAVSGDRTWSYHALNLALHIAAAWLLFAIADRMLVRRGVIDRGSSIAIAFFGALLWTVHPLQTESVTYLVQRAESLYGLWLLLAFWCFVRGVEANDPTEAERPVSARRWNGWFTGCVAACALGMATKEAMVVAPILLALYDRVFLAGSWRGVWARRRCVHLATAGTWLILLALVAATGGRGGTFALASGAAWWRYDLTQAVALARYVALTFLPAPLVIDYGTFWVKSVAEILPGTFLLIALLAGTYVAWRRWPALGFAGVAFFLLLAPSSLPPGTIQMIVEHRMYLPLAAVLPVLVLALHTVLGRKMAPVALAIAVAFGGLVARRNADYASPIRLFEDTVAKRPHNARAMALLGDYDRQAGRLDDARRWLERSLAIEPGVVPVLNNLGNVWQELDEPVKAVVRFEQAYTLAPHDPTTLNNLGNALVLAGRTEEGLAHLREALRLEPHALLSQLNLASALARTGRHGEAAERFAALAASYPENAEIHAGYAAVLQALGRHDEAIAELHAAVQRRGDDAALHDRLGVALGRAGHLTEALEEFEAALRLDPADPVARKNAALARQRLGR